MFQVIDQDSFIFRTFQYFIACTIMYHLPLSKMTVFRLNAADTPSGVAQSDSGELCKPTGKLESCESKDTSEMSTSFTISTCSCSSFDEDMTEALSDFDSKPASVNEISASKNSIENSSILFLNLGSDVMVAVLSFLEPRETIDLLTIPLCKQWRLSCTLDQELWRTMCCTKPFSADLPSYNAAIDFCDDHDDGPFCFPNDSNFSSENKNALGEYRLMYTSFVRCRKYLDRVQNDDDLEGRVISSVKELKKSDNASSFPTFGVTKPLRNFLARSKEHGLLKSVIGKIETVDISCVSTDGCETRQDPSSKKKIEENNRKPKYGTSMITSRLWGPSATGVPSHLNLPKSCAIYSIVNWMVAHPNVPGIQTMCIESLPSLLEDEHQRKIGRRVGLVEVVLCAMLRFPEIIELHIAIFHAIVLLARPIGGREGMLFDTSMAASTRSIGLTSVVELSDAVSLAARCGGHPSLTTKNNQQLATSTNSGNSFSTLVKKQGNQTGKTGISLLVDSMQRFPSSEKLQSMACWAFVNVALVPLQKNILMTIGGIEAVLSAMEKHPKSFDVQFRALFSLINLAVCSRQSEFFRDSSIDGAAATRAEEAILVALVPKIINLTVSAMKNFSDSEQILNRGCLVVHNLSQSSEFMPTLLEIPDCYQILEWCHNNHASERTLRRSISSTLQRMIFYLEQHPQVQERLSISVNRQNPERRQQFW